MIDYLAQERERDAREFAEQARRIKEAERGAPNALRPLSLQVRFGMRMVAWGTRMQAGALSLSPGEDTPCSG
ncbi:MAG TPA: hypothetical protein VF813_09515 [Anaerolineaceae bacterium]